MSRERILGDAFDIVVRTMGLRVPQVEALRAFRDALVRLPAPLGACTPQQRREFLTIRDAWRHPYHPAFTISLATGVGKTRLAGAMIALLWLAQEARTFLILAPRRAVLRRFENALDPRFREYLFVEPQLVPEPSVVRADEIDSPRAFEFEGDLFRSGPKIFLLSPQLISSSDRFSLRPEFSECSPLEALQGRNDLVVIADEAHHIGKLSKAETTAWGEAVRQLSPALQIGLTATPRREAGEYLLYDYPLQKALADGFYTKSVHICVRSFKESTLNADDIDRSAILYSLDRLDRKKDAVEAAVQSRGFPPTKPVCVFFARDIAHAEEVRGWLIATGRVVADEVLLTHSRMSKSEEEIERLLSIEDPRNPVRVVVNVMELTEGWDVTNVYVVTPLRALATFQGALQAMGRGLRLPAGARAGDPVLDDLDIVCFGREALESIVRNATEWSGAGAGGVGQGVKVTAFDQSDPVLVDVHVPAQRVESISFARCECVEDDLVLEMHSDALARVKEAVVTEVELAAAQTRLGFGRSKVERERFIRATTFRVIKGLGRYLSDSHHGAQVSELVRSWLDAVRPGAPEVEFDPAEVGQEIAKVLEAGARIRPARYEARGGTEICSFPDFTAKQEVMIGPGQALPRRAVADLPVFNGSNFVVGQAFAGWVKGLHPAYAFDSRPEALLARLLDRDDEVQWWVRNDPVRFRLETPAGQYRPDFIVCLRGAEGSPRLLILEAKGDHLWIEPHHEAQLKSIAAKEWARLQGREGFEFDAAVALQSEIERSGSWGELSTNLQ